MRWERQKERERGWVGWVECDMEKDAPLWLHPQVMQEQ